MEKAVFFCLLLIAAEYQFAECFRHPRFFGLSSLFGLGHHSEEEEQVTEEPMPDISGHPVWKVHKYRGIVFQPMPPPSHYERPIYLPTQPSYGAHARQDFNGGIDEGSGTTTSTGTSYTPYSNAVGPYSGTESSTESESETREHHNKPGMIRNAVDTIIDLKEHVGKGISGMAASKRDALNAYRESSKRNRPDTTDLLINLAIRYPRLAEFASEHPEILEFIMNKKDHSDSDDNGMELMSEMLEMMRSPYPPSAPYPSQETPVPHQTYGVPEEPQPTYGVPEEPQPTYGVPEEPQPTYGVPEEPQPTYGAPEEPQPTYGVPEEPQPTYGVPKEPQRTYGAPEEPQPTYGVPEEPQPTYGVPEEPQPTYSVPEEPQPTYGVPEEPQPTYGTPEQPLPMYSVPEEPQPTYGTPEQPQPMYSVPEEPQPTYGAPKQPQPMYGLPEEPQPTYGAPKPPQPTYGAPEPPQPTYVSPERPLSIYGAPEQPQRTYTVPEEPQPTYGAPEAPKTTYGTLPELPELPELPYMKEMEVIPEIPEMPDMKVPLYPSPSVPYQGAYQPPASKPIFRVPQTPQPTYSVSEPALYSTQIPQSSPETYEAQPSPSLYRQPVPQSTYQSYVSPPSDTYQTPAGSGSAAFTKATSPTLLPPYTNHQSSFSQAHAGITTAHFPNHRQPHYTIVHHETIIPGPDSPDYVPPVLNAISYQLRRNSVVKDDKITPESGFTPSMGVVKSSGGSFFPTDEDYLPPFVQYKQDMIPEASSNEEEVVVDPPPSSTKDALPAAAPSLNEPSSAAAVAAMAQAIIRSDLTEADASAMAKEFAKLRNFPIAAVNAAFANRFRGKVHMAQGEVTIDTPKKDREG